SIAVLYGARAIVIAVVTMLALALVTLPFVGLHSWIDFSVAIRDSVPTCPFSVTNLSIACFAEPVIGLGAAKILSLAIAAGLLVAAAVAGPTLIGLTA